MAPLVPAPYDSGVTYATTDAALASLAATGPELVRGGPNHAPMVIDALATLGRDEAVSGWLEAYRPRLVEDPEMRDFLGDDWPCALGRFERLGDWQEFFRRELSASPWTAVLRMWCVELAPGIMAAGTHGLIRTAHAARGLADAETPERREELARALAYWAARYQPLPGEPQLRGACDVAEAVRRLPVLEPELDRRGSPPRVVRRVLDERPDLLAGVDALAKPRSIETALGELTQAGARVYLRNARHRPLILLHAVTAPADLRLLLPFLAPDDRLTVFAYMWQAVAAWIVTFGSDAQDVGGEITLATDDLVGRAVESGDEHAIKLTEAALREETLNASDLYRRAAEDWLSRVLGARDWSRAQRVAAGLITSGS